ncbi:MAG: phosphoribosylanthranilate isomerase [Candidatus Omnitrophica bacterium]|nr:phosphoribosylanthranilate isomerase [Candidatus Omnitrophota bacterium]MCF7893983.1 phosphoribosylanthranilate isomerase [Candidatus Omnitrophota bacterium]
MIRVKICGITNLEDALLAEQLGADALGFIFTKKSPRYIRPALAKKIIARLGPFISKAGVFMNQKKEEVSDIASSVGLDLLQFHGKETVTYCNQFMPQYKVVKVCFPDYLAETILRYQGLDALMFDIPFKEKKKEKKTLSADFLKFIKTQIKKEKKVILSGGLDSTNIKNVIKISPYGVDVASGIEELVGKKDKKAMKKFIERVKNVSS